MAVDAFVLILAMLALGMAFARWRVLPDNASEVLNTVVLYVCLPAAVLVYVPRLVLDASLVGVAAIPWILAGVAVGIVSLAARLFGFSREVGAVLMLCVALGNTSFVGYPLVRALLGEDALPVAVVYDQFGSFLLLSTFGLTVIARQGDGPPPTVAQIALRVARFPPVWALILALTVVPAEPPHWIASALVRLADAMLPLALLAVGLSVRLRLSREEIRPLLLGLLLKLGVMPVVALGLGRLFGLPVPTLEVVVLESAMPTMITAASLAIVAGLAPRLAAAMVGYGLLVAMVTVPAWTLLLGWLYG
jgi:predicted permease